MLGFPQNYGTLSHGLGRELYPLIDIVYVTYNLMK